MKYLIILSSLSVVLACKPSTYLSSHEELINLYPIGEGKLWGFADENGNKVIPLQFEELGFFTSGLATAKLDGKYGYINKLGEFEIKPKFDAAQEMRYNYAYVNKRGKGFQIDRKGKRLRGKNMKSGVTGYCMEPFRATEPLDIFEEKDGAYVLKTSYFQAQRSYDPEANFTLDQFTFDEIIPFSHTAILVKVKNKYGFFVHYNHVGMSPIWVDEIALDYPDAFTPETISSISNCMVKKDGKWGLIGSMGKYVIEPEFLSMKKVNEIFYLVEYEADKFGCITSSNKRYF